ncbi:MAG: hypothetical protein U5K33_02300 [Halofilum sp. (in: g-proteobacteria)]|nr:hypothetical protein [Halofilum sp. (in: g-proteobacteria)]
MNRDPGASVVKRWTRPSPLVMSSAVTAGRPDRVRAELPAAAVGVDVLDQAAMLVVGKGVDRAAWLRDAGQQAIVRVLHRPGRASGIGQACEVAVGIDRKNGALAVGGYDGQGVAGGIALDSRGVAITDLKRGEAATTTLPNNNLSTGTWIDRSLMSPC